MVRLKRCPKCLAQIDDASEACAACGTSVAEPGPQAAVSTAGPKTRGREVLSIAAALAGAAIVTFIFLSARGGHSSTLVAAAPGAAVANPLSRPPTSSAEQKWRTGNRALWLGNRRGAAFELLAENRVQTWFGPTQPMLVIRCESRAMEAFVYIKSAARIEPHVDGKTVKVAIDDQPVRTERWSDSDDRVALFAPDGAAFARQLLHANTLRFGYSPHNADDVVAQFHVAGLAPLIGPVARECGWKK
jgi:hypothetical protein